MNLNNTKGFLLILAILGTSSNAMLEKRPHPINRYQDYSKPLNVFNALNNSRNDSDVQDVLNIAFPLMKLDGFSVKDDPSYQDFSKINNIKLFEIFVNSMSKFKKENKSFYSELDIDKIYKNLMHSTLMAFFKTKNKTFISQIMTYPELSAYSPGLQNMIYNARATLLQQVWPLLKGSARFSLLREHEKNFQGEMLDSIKDAFFPDLSVLETKLLLDTLSRFQYKEEPSRYIHPDFYMIHDILTRNKVSPDRYLIILNHYIKLMTNDAMKMSLAKIMLANQQIYTFGPSSTEGENALETFTTHLRLRGSVTAVENAQEILNMATDLWQSVSENGSDRMQLLAVKHISSIIKLISKKIKNEPPRP